MKLGQQLAALWLVGITSVQAGPRSHGIDADTGAETWATEAHGVTLRLTQILPDQVRAFYINRGFADGDVEPYAQACVYMTVLRNDAAPGEVGFRLADWRVRHAAGETALPGSEDWMTRWRQRGLPEPARIAFRWAQFPSEQEYAPGEWNQGMLAIGLPAGSRFDLIARWTVAGKTMEGVLTDVRCPAR